MTEGRLVRHLMLAAVLLLASLLAAPAGAAPRGDLAIVHARVYPAPDAGPIADATVVVRNGKIVAVGPSERVRAPRGLRTLDAAGASLVAGFWNAHVHIMPTDLLGADKAPAAQLQGGLDAMLTRWGFTSVFDIASDTGNTLALRRRIEAGEIAGPAILTVGDPFFPKDGTPIYVREYLKAHGWQDEEVATPGQAAARARRQLDRGTDGVKIFAGAIVGGPIGVLPMRVDIARAVVDEAHRRGKPAFAHPTNLAGLNVAIESGIDVLAHTTAGDPRDGDGPWPPELIARMRARNMALIPTLSLFDSEMRKDGAPQAAIDGTLERVQGEVRDYAAAGGQILFGTDVGFTDVYDTTEEYRLLANALSWQQILAALTTAPSERFGFARSKGRVAVGMDGDLVLLDGDPALDPAAFARVRATIRGGRVIWAEAGQAGEGADSVR
jgi:imidazolonepropionase-like amidohydrolase